MMKRKLLAVLILLHLFGASYAADNWRVVLNCDNVALKEVLDLIHTQSGYDFVYVEGLTKNVRVTAHVDSRDINKIMDVVLKGTNIKYKVSGQTTIYLALRSKTEATPGKDGYKRLKGTVYDKQGKPLQGVVVSGKDNKSYDVSGADGAFSIDGEIGDILTFSLLGYNTETVEIKELNTTLYLSEDIKFLDEAVVIGYGVQKKSDLTSAIAKVSAETIENQPVASIGQALQGRAAGVNIISSSGRPGAYVQIRIRGIGSVNDNEPLYVVDGMTVSSIASLNPSDIASIEILKDASSAAIYGSRGANGVILVTTKKGYDMSRALNSETQLTTHIDFKSYVGIANPTRQLNPARANEYLEMVGQAFGVESNTYNLVAAEYEKGYDTNWWKEVNRSNALLQNYDLSVSGGNSAFSYLMSGSYLDQQGIDRASSLKRVSARINTEIKLKKWLTVGENLSIIGTLNRSGADSGKKGFVMAALMADPLYPALDPDKNDPNPLNNYGTSSLTNIANPVAYQDRYLNNRNLGKAINLIGNIYMDVNIFKGLKFKSDFGLEMGHGIYNSFSPVYYLDVDDKNYTANAWAQFDRSFRWNWINTLSYNLKAGKHELSAMAGYQAEAYNSQYMEGNKFGQPNNDMTFQWLSGGINGDRISGSYSDEAMLSAFGRINYIYAGRYIFSASFRADGSSKFGPGHKWGYFPAVSVGWKLTEEQFFKQLGLRQVNLAKIRLGWGQLGNNRIPSGAYNTFIRGNINNRFFFNGEEHVQGYAIINAGNPEVCWERTETINAGLDLAFFDSRLTATVDVFNKDTKGMLIQIPTSDIFSTFSPWENVGKVNNRGWEMSIDWRDDIKDFSYSVGFNVSGYKNKVISLGGTKPYVDSYGDISALSGYCRTQEGMPIGYFYGFKTDGIFQTPREVANYVSENGSQLQPSAMMGDFRFVNTKQDEVINDEDKIYLGSPHPDVYLGLNLSLSYKNIDLQAAFYGTIGNEIFNAFKYYTSRPVGFANVESGAVAKCWTVGSNIDDQPRLTLEDGNNNYRISDYYVEDGSYLRLKNLQLGYSIPERLLKHVGMSNCRLYLASQNLFTLTRYSGLDPEIANGSARSNGVDVGNYPQTRVFQFGFNVSF